jgi:hypothetical protein
VCIGRVSEVDARNPLVFPPFAKLVLIVEKGELFDDVIHD